MCLGHYIFTDQFIFRMVLRKLWISFKFHKLVSKTYGPKNDNFCLLIMFSFPFLYLFYLYFQWAHRCGGDSIWVGKKCPEMCLKINLSIKTPWRRPSVEVACFGLWAPEKALFTCQNWFSANICSIFNTLQIRHQGTILHSDIINRDKSTS